MGPYQVSKKSNKKEKKPCLLVEVNVHGVVPYLLKFGGILGT